MKIVKLNTVKYDALDILTHTFSGLAVGATLATFSSRRKRDKIAIIALGGVGGLLPDLDVISLWSGFDNTLGNWFQLKQSGASIYSAHYWYSHHGFMHSLFAGCLLTVLIGITRLTLKYRVYQLPVKYWKELLVSEKLLLLSFFIGFGLHLLEDIPTPSSTWGGVNLLWPSKSYTGGTGAIWWWNNYDLFLIAFGTFVLNTIVLLVKKQVKAITPKLALVIFILALGLGMGQIKSRDYSFAYEGHTTDYSQFEANSQKQQQKILGPRLYRIMKTIDNKIPLHF